MALTRNQRVTRLLSGRWNADSLAVFVPREKCRCGAVCTECTEDGTLLCGDCHADEENARADAADDAACLRDEVARGPVK